MMNPLTRHLGWTTRLRVSDVIDGHKIKVDRNERIARFSVHRVVIATKLAASAQPTNKGTAAGRSRGVSAMHTITFQACGSARPIRP